MPDIYSIAAEFRRQLLDHDKATARALIDYYGYYGEVYRRLSRQLDALLAQIRDARERGEDVSLSWLYRAERLRILQDQVQAEIQRFADYAGVQITEAQRVAVGMAQEHTEQLALVGLGEPPPGVTVTWARLPRDAVTDLVGFLQDGSPLRDLLDELGPEASRSVRDALVAGVATGQNPRTIARQIRQALGGNLVRALTISRTEMLRSYRTASLRSYQANADVMEGWVWHAALDRRTCGFCWSQHGRVFPIDAPFATHPRCRCSPMPRTVGWEAILGEKGRGIPDTRPKIERGEDLFERLPEERKLEILGPAKYAAYQDGKLSLSDLAGFRRDPKWGPVGGERSLRDILREKYGEAEGAKLASQYIQAGRNQAVMARKTYRLAEYSPKLKKALAGAEQKLAGEAIETLRVFDLQGNPVLTISGESAGISMTDEQVAACRGMIVTHNHPLGTSFSDLDVKLLLDSGAREIRAVGREFVYSLSVSEAISFEDVAPAIAHVFRRLVDEDTIACNTLGADMEELVATRWHRIWEQIAEMRGWTYRREKRK